MASLNGKIFSTIGQAMVLPNGMLSNTITAKPSAR